MSNFRGISEKRWNIDERRSNTHILPFLEHALTLQSDLELWDDLNGLLKNHQFRLGFVSLQMRLADAAEVFECFVDVFYAETFACIICKTAEIFVMAPNLLVNYYLLSRSLLSLSSGVRERSSSDTEFWLGDRIGILFFSLFGDRSLGSCFIPGAVWLFLSPLIPRAKISGFI